ncbi:MAG TPA: nucleotide pyrophosphohydrolase [Solirubrobacteraceae bacterium]|nr:nucleotide pyrophosphohydrolase [Solirubrobacteraceae bacterium]
MSGRTPEVPGVDGAAYDSIAYVTEQLVRFRDERDWGQFHTPKNLALGIAVEAGELLEHFQWIADADVPGYLERHRPEVAEELADVAIHVIQLANALGIPLGEALRAKLALNAERYPVALARGNAAKHGDRGGEREDRSGRD